MPTDHTQGIVEQWARLRPEIGTEAMAAVARILRAARLIEADMAQLFGHFRLNRGEFDVLAALLRAGPPHRLTPTALSQGLLLSTSAMTNRLDGLEAAGLVAREPVPGDRRGVLVRLTDEGRTIMERVLDVHLPNIERLVGPLTVEDRRTLNDCLARLLTHLEALDGSADLRAIAAAAAAGDP